MNVVLSRLGFTGDDSLEVQMMENERVNVKRTGW